MRSETLYLWGLEPEPSGVERAALDHGIDRQSALHTPRGNRYAVEVCWITDGVVTCRTYQVSAANEVRAARIACQSARDSLSQRPPGSRRSISSKFRGETAMSKQRPTADQLADLIAQPHFGRSREAMPSTDPIQPTPMVVAVDEIEVYDHNPRQLANDKYEEIKASIRASGMDQTLTITRRPDAPRYMIAAGGNTRLQAVKALWKETGEERYRSIHCLYRPWQGDTKTLVAHLKENDVRGDLSFIDRARGLTQLKALVETESGQSLSLREFLAFLASKDTRVSHPVLILSAYAIQSLESAIPTALGAGMSRNQVDRIRKLHKAFVTAWSSLQVPDIDAGESLFVDLLGRHDDDVIDLDLLHRDAVNELSVSADCDVQHAAMIYGAAIDGRDLDGLIESVSNDSQTEDGEEEDAAKVSPPPASQPQQQTEPNAPQSAVRQERSAAAIQSPATVRKDGRDA